MSKLRVSDIQGYIALLDELRQNLNYEANRGTFYSRYLGTYNVFLVHATNTLATLLFGTIWPDLHPLPHQELRRAVMDFAPLYNSFAHLPNDLLNMHTLNRLAGMVRDMNETIVAVVDENYVIEDDVNTPSPATTISPTSP